MAAPTDTPTPVSLPANAVELRGLTKIYQPTGKAGPKHALKGIDLAIPRGSLFGLLGPNGAGKSTMINILAGLVNKTGGTASIWGHEVSEQPRRARASIGVVPQELNMDPFFTPREMLELQAGLYGVPKGERRTEELLDAVGLKDKADAYSRSLSGGMKRRLMVAKAMVHTPPVLVLDVTAIGHAAGIPRELQRPTATASRTSSKAEREGLRVILFRALCGERRAIAMSAVEQVERADSGCVRNPGPNAQIVLGEEILPLVGVGEGAELPEKITVLRLGDGGEPIAYAAREVLDISMLSADLKPVKGKPDVVGVALVDGEPAELVDCHALFAGKGDSPRSANHALTCRLNGSDGWMKNFLGPIIEAAGYRIVEGDEPADIAFVDPSAAAEAECDARVAIRLRSEPGSGESADGIYRYDRAALMSALLRAGEELAA